VITRRGSGRERRDCTTIDPALLQPRSQRYATSYSVGFGISLALEMFRSRLALADDAVVGSALVFEI